MTKKTTDKRALPQKEEKTTDKRALPQKEGKTTESFPDQQGHFGTFGGRFVAETLMPLILEIEKAYEAAKYDRLFQEELDDLRKHYIGRPSPLYFAARLTEHLKGAKIYFKRDELNHTGAHKINNCLGQILLAKKMGKTRLIAETGAGQHGVATATIAARLNMECVVFMGTKDINRQKINCEKMKLLGATIKPVETGNRTLKDAMNEALRDWVAHVKTSFYVIGTTAGPHPYPKMVRDFQSVIGQEARAQILERENRLPNVVLACIGGGSNALGLFYGFMDDEVRLVGVEAAGKGLSTSYHAASLAKGSPAILHGNKSHYLQDEDGQIQEAHSISAGLDYPGIGPEHSFLHQTKRAEYVSATDEEALNAFRLCAKLEGIIPALEPAHALAYLLKLAPKMSKNDIVVVNLCGRGDKDMDIVSHINDNL